MPITGVVAILEDDPRRVDAMRPVLEELLPACDHVFIANAPDMIRWLGENLWSCVLISLDHDLDSVVPRERQAFDPGCGRDVADFLAKSPPVCPVIVHTTNYDASLGMMRVLGETGWPLRRVYPCDDLAWIARDWAADVRQLIEHGLVF